MKDKRGLGRQAPAVLAAPRNAPGVLAKIGAEPSPEAQAVRALQSTLRKQLARERQIIDDLGAALEGWETVAGAGDQVRIDALRKRWGIAATETAPDDQDLTDATAER